MLTKQDFERVASYLGGREFEPEILQAVTEVEAPRGGFDASGNLTILFEAHVFWRELKAKGINPKTYLPTYKDVLSDKWNPKLYGKYSAQWPRLNKASMIHKEAAYRSASYGLFQILGGHAEALGYKDVFQFVNHQKQGEAQQLQDFANFLQVNKLVSYLQNKDWAGFARRYNGPAYGVNKYDVKLAEAYKKLTNDNT